MTVLQKEVHWLLPQIDCTSQYDERSGYLNIAYEVTELLSLHADGIIFFKKENLLTQQRQNQFFAV